MRSYFNYNHNLAKTLMIISNYGQEKHKPSIVYQIANSSVRPVLQKFYWQTKQEHKKVEKNYRAAFYAEKIL